jgi:hypothetical protein
VINCQQRTCVSLLANPSPAPNADVAPGSFFHLIYSGQAPLATSVPTPAAFISDGKGLSVNVKAASVRKLHYVDSNGGAEGHAYQDRLTFKLPANLAPGAYNVTLTVSSITGQVDQWNWPINVSP